MTTLRRFMCKDLLRFNNVNLDVLTETYNMNFYLSYMAKWPEYFLVKNSPSDRMVGYVLGKAEGEGELWHGHVTAVTVAPDYRRLGVASQLMSCLESISDEVHNCYFVDLFVRASNALAIQMYSKFGYSIYRRVLGYYCGEEDGLDMRKAMSRDTEKKSMMPLGRPILPDELEW
eukprot:65915_1